MAAPSTIELLLTGVESTGQSKELDASLILLGSIVTGTEIWQRCNHVLKRSRVAKSQVQDISIRWKNIDQRRQGVHKTRFSIVQFARVNDDIVFENEYGSGVVVVAVFIIVAFFGRALSLMANMSLPQFHVGKGASNLSRGHFPWKRRQNIAIPSCIAVVIPIQKTADRLVAYLLLQ